MPGKDPTQRFSSRVDHYVRFRPGYPPEVVALLKSECGLKPDSTIADIAFGTGLFTRLLLENGNRVWGVEPNAEMRRAGEEFLAAYPRFTSVAGTAEATTLPEQSVDIVTAAQAAQKYAQTGPQQVQQQDARAKQALAQVEQAQAQLDQAKLNLSYTRIVAPEDGIITRKSVEINQNVSPGQNLLTLVSLEDLWVTANFKETQLRNMRGGQKVKVHVDSTGEEYDGRVTQIGGATGSVLSLFPPENATGNYVKVVQRVPVRIDFTDLIKEDPYERLRPGLSVEPKVWVK